MNRAPRPVSTRPPPTPNPSSTPAPPPTRSRTSGGDIIRGTIDRFFHLLPTPSAVLDAPDELITDLIHPLGLQPVRLRAVRSISRDFLATDWEDPTAFYGCGKFVADSYRIFCRGDVSGAGGSAGGAAGGVGGWVGVVGEQQRGWTPVRAVRGWASRECGAGRRQRGPF
jgi:hypothetical protein